jgi:hypothetical protein
VIAPTESERLERLESLQHQVQQLQLQLKELHEENAALRNANVALLEKTQARPRPRARPRDALTVIAAGDLCDIHGAAMPHKKQKRLKSPLDSDPATLTEAPSTSTSSIEAIDATEV